MDGWDQCSTSILFYSILLKNPCTLAADSQLRLRGSAGSGESRMEQSARLFAREAPARLGRNLTTTTTTRIQRTTTGESRKGGGIVHFRFACGPGEAGLVDGAGDALLRVLGETPADPQQLPGGEGRCQRLRLGVWRG